VRAPINVFAIFKVSVKKKKGGGGGMNEFKKKKKWLRIKGEEKLKLKI